MEGGNRTIRFGKRYKLIKPHAANNANSIALRDKSNCQRCCAAVAGVLLLLLQLGQRLKGCRQQCQLSAICTVARCCCSSFGNRLGNRLIVEAVATTRRRSSSLALPRISIHNTHTHYPEQPTTSTSPIIIISIIIIRTTRRQLLPLLATCCSVVLLLAQLLVSGSNT